MEKLVCSGCGKEYKSEMFYLKHIEKCDKIEQIDEIEKTIDEIVEEKSFIGLKEKIEIEKEEINIYDETLKKVIDYFNLTKGGMPSASTEWKRAFEWRNILVDGKKETNIECLSCRRKVYNTLISIWNKNK